MSTVAASLQTELDRDGARVFACVELGSAPLRYAESDADVTALGPVSGKLTSPIPAYSRGISNDYTLQSTEIAIEVSDDDLSIAMDVAGSSPALVRGATAKVRIGALTSAVAPSDWCDDWTGIIADIPQMVAERRWSIRLRTNDLPLERPVVPPNWIISRSSWPLAPAASLGQMAPIIFGVHDSVGSTDEGAVPLIRVGPGVYLAGAGGIYSVDRVYVSGDLADAADWAFSRETIDGQLYSLVRFDPDPAVGDDGAIDETVEVTADLHGLTSVGDGSGSVVTDLVDQLTIIANNWWWGSWKSGAWDTTSAPIHSSSWTTAKAFLAAVSFGGHHGARIISGLATQLPTAGNIMQEWCASVVVYPCWTGAGTIALRAKDHRLAWTYASTPWVRPEDCLRMGDAAESSISVEYPTRRIDRAAVSFLVVGGQARETLEVRDQAITGAAGEAVLLAWGRASAL